MGKNRDTHIDCIAQIQNERDIFRSKPTVGSVCGGMCRARSFKHSMGATSFHSITSDDL